MNGDWGISRGENKWYQSPLRLRFENKSWQTNARCIRIHTFVHRTEPLWVLETTFTNCNAFLDLGLNGQCSARSRVVIGQFWFRFGNCARGSGACITMIESGRSRSTCCWKASRTRFKWCRRSGMPTCFDLECTFMTKRGIDTIVGATRKLSRERFELLMCWICHPAALYFWFDCAPQMWCRSIIWPVKKWWQSVKTLPHFRLCFGSGKINWHTNLARFNNAEELLVLLPLTPIVLVDFDFAAVIFKPHKAQCPNIKSGCFV